MSFDVQEGSAEPPKRLFFHPDLAGLWPKIFFPLNVSISFGFWGFFGGEEEYKIWKFHGKVTSSQTGFNNVAFAAGWGFIALVLTE